MFRLRLHLSIEKTGLLAIALVSLSRDQMQSLMTVHYGFMKRLSDIEVAFDSRALCLPRRSGEVSVFYVNEQMYAQK